MEQEKNKNENNNILKLIIALLIGLGIGYFVFGNNSKVEEDLMICKTFKCEYNPSTKLYEFIHLSLAIEKYFPTQEQCMDYCATNLKTDSVLKRQLKELYDKLGNF